MSESCEQLCASCPNRSSLSRVIAQMLVKREVTEDCDGYVHVIHGKAITRFRSRGEALPDRNTWSTVTYNPKTGDELFVRTSWGMPKRLCGKEPIEPRPGEVTYGSDEKSFAFDGHEMKAFISGDAEGIQAALFDLAMIDFLD